MSVTSLQNVGLSVRAVSALARVKPRCEFKYDLKLSELALICQLLKNGCPSDDIMLSVLKKVLPDRYKDVETLHTPEHSLIDFSFDALSEYPSLIDDIIAIHSKDTEVTERKNFVYGGGSERAVERLELHVALNELHLLFTDFEMKKRLIGLESKYLIINLVNKVC